MKSSPVPSAALLPWIKAQLMAFQIRLRDDPLPADGIVVCDDSDLLAVVGICYNDENFRAWERDLRQRCQESEADAIVIFIPDDLPQQLHESLITTPFGAPVRILCIPRRIIDPNRSSDQLPRVQATTDSGDGSGSGSEEPDNMAAGCIDIGDLPLPDESLGAAEDVDHAVMQQPFAAVMKELRPRLLDLGLRNRLLNYLPAGGITVVDELPEEILRILVANERTMVLDDTGERDTGPHRRSAQPRSAQSSARRAEAGQMRLDLETAPPTELPPPAAGQAARRHSDTHLQTDLSRKALQARGTTVYRRYDESIKAYGINPLYLALGFLQWYEAEQADTERVAPLILVPISIGREKVVVREAIAPGDQDYDPRSTGTQYRTATRYRFSVTYTGDPIAPNHSLQAKLLRDFGLVLPELSREDEDIDPEAYFQQVRGMLARFSDRRWSVKRQCSIGFFNFTKEVIHEDLGDPGWREQGAGSQLVEMLTGNQDTIAVRDYGQQDVEAMHAKGALPLVYDADSSQCAAISAALEARTLVVHGPPGTGKSQSITNLIGAAMAQGLRVLFVAAKEAALQVVADRLERAGLGPFLLPLYSHKTRPKDVLENIRTRMALHGRRAATDDPCKKVLAEAEPPRKRLAEYMRLIEQPSGVEADEADIELDAGGLLYLAARSQEDFREAWLGLGRKEKPPQLQLSVPIASYGNRKQRSMAEETLRDLVDLAHADALRLCRPWHGWDVRPLLNDTAEQAMDAIAEIASPLEALADRLRRGPIPLAVESLAILRLTPQLRSIIDDLPTADQPRMPRLARTALARDGADQAKRLLEQVSTEDAMEVQLGRLLPDAPEQAASLLDSVPQRLGGETLKPSLLLTDLIELRLQSAKVVESIQQLVAAGKGVLERLQITMDLPWNGVETLVRIAATLARADAVAIQDLDPRFLATTCREQLDRAREECRKLREAHQVLARHVSWADIPPAEKVSDLRRLLRMREGAWYAWLGVGRLARARRECRVFLHKTEDDAKRSHLLEKIEGWRIASTKFAADGLARQRLGPLFRGLETDWARLDQAITLTQDLLQCFGFQETQSYLSRPSKGPLSPDAANSLTSALRGATETLTAAQEALARSLEKGVVPSAWQRHDAVLCTQSAEGWQQLHVECGKAIAWWEDAFKPGSPWRSCDLTEVRDGLVAVAALHGIRKTLSSHPLRHHLGEDPSALLPEAQSSIDWAERLVAAVHSQPLLAEVIAPALRDPSVTLDLAPIRRWIGELGPLHAAIDDRLQALEAFGSCAEEDAFSRMSVSTLAVQQRTLALRQAAGGHLVAWSRVRATTSRAEELGCLDYLRSVEREQLPPDLLIPAFRSTIFVSLATDLLRRVPDLAAVDAVKLERWRQSFRTADGEWAAASRRRIATQLLGNDVPAGRRSARVSELTEQQLLINELGKQRRHIPMRQLVHRAGKALLAIKPCWLMSPLSVSSFLPREAEMFDLVVMDEASQVRTEEALGGILRARSVVIFGDPMQMPPTDFFSTGLDEEGETIASDSKSILDLAIQTLPASCNKHLTWHYRSLHQDLIAYSNAHYYRNKLTIFPSRMRRGSGLGISWVPCAGRFAAGRNATEAEAVVQAVLQHARQIVSLAPERRESLGVVAMNREQADLIADLLDGVDRQGGADAAALAAVRETPEPLFIRNLETVQGDERDHIIISCTYGPDAVNGKVYQRFGPILRAGGERRLNVLFSRSKRRMTVVSSLDPEHIQTGRSLGARHFRGFLSFAKSGVLQDGGCLSGREPDSDFEIDVGRAVIQLGYSVEYQVGVNGFFVDIGVVDPQDPGAFLIGIECDGATFHSSRVARDRDRLRQEILESRGWTLHRIWSTEWFQNRAGCIALLKERLEKHAKACARA